MFVNKQGGFSPFKRFQTKEESPLNRSTKEFFSSTVDFGKMVRGKAPEADLKRQQRKVFEVSLAATLGLMLLASQVARLFSLNAATADTVNIQIEVADIPPTQQFKKPPPPPRPSVPIPTEEDTVPEDMTIATTDIDLSDIPPPPGPPADDELPIFVAYDEAPQIIGGFPALQKHLKYPKLAQQAGVEGIVFVKVLVGVSGKTEDADIIKAKPANMGFEQSAISAVKKVRWEPAKQRDKKIRVWVSIPVQFKLVSS